MITAMRNVVNSLRFRVAAIAVAATMGAAGALAATLGGDIQTLQQVVLDRGRDERVLAALHHITEGHATADITAADVAALRGQCVLVWQGKLGAKSPTSTPEWPLRTVTWTEVPSPTCPKPVVHPQSDVPAPGRDRPAFVDNRRAHTAIHGESQPIPAAEMAKPVVSFANPGRAEKHFPDDTIVHVTLREPFDDSHTHIGWFAAQVAVIGAAAAAISGLLAWLLAGFALGPVKRASRAVRHIAEGDRDARLPVRGSDSFAQLSADVNTMTDSLVASIDDAHAAKRQQQQIVADVAHELRTPLSALVASSEALRDPETRAEAAAEVVPQLGRMAHLTETLLHLSSFDAGRQELRLDRVDVTNVVREAVKLQGEPVVLTSEEPVEAVVDPPRVLLMVRNLLSNAHAHGKPPVTCRVDADDDTVRITVSDQGSGVHPRQRETIFDRFVRGDRSRTGEGSGLGLAIVRENARLHGGDVALHDDGRTFEVILPRRTDAT